MGFKIPNRKLIIELSDYEGAEATCRLDVKMKTFFRLQDLASSTEGTAGIEKSYKMFGEEILESWNFEDDNGKVIPATSEGMMEIPPSLSIALMSAWIDQIQMGKEKPSPE